MPTTLAIRPNSCARNIGMVGGTERLSLTIVLRRRPDGPAAPGFSEFTPPAAPGRRLSGEDFAARFGAHTGDIDRVVDFLHTHGLNDAEVDAAARTVTVSGTVETISSTFAVRPYRYERTVAGSGAETYRGRDGYIHVPSELADVIVGVFGLDNRRITKRNVSSEPVGQQSLDDVARHYRFPSSPAHGQTIALFSEDGYRMADIQQFYASTAAGKGVPRIVEVAVGANNNNGNADRETTQDICIASGIAQGADIAVYFTTYDQKGWVDAITRIVHPKVGTQCARSCRSVFTWPTVTVRRT